MVEEERGKAEAREGYEEKGGGASATECRDEPVMSLRLPFVCLNFIWLFLPFLVAGVPAPHVLRNSGNENICT